MSAWFVHRLERKNTMTVIKNRTMAAGSPEQQEKAGMTLLRDALEHRIAADGGQSMMERPS